MNLIIVYTKNKYPTMANHEGRAILKTRKVAKGDYAAPQSHKKDPSARA